MGVQGGSRNQAAIVSLEELVISMHSECRTVLLKCEAYWVVNYKFAAQEQTVNHNHYADGDCRKYAVKLTWKLEFRDWLFHLDSAPSWQKA